MFGQRDTGAAPPASEKLIELKPGIGILFQVWWAFTWRYFLWTLLVIVALLIMVFVVSLIVHFMGADRETARSIGGIAGFIVGLTGSIWAAMKAFRQILGKKFSGYKLVFLTPAVDGYKD